MRSTLFVLGSCGVIGGAFFVYNAFQARQTNIHLTLDQPHPPAPMIDHAAPSWNRILPGHGVWVSSYDEQSGVLKNRFRSADYMPQKDGRIEVTEPIAEFYMPNHQMMRLIGRTGEISMPQDSHSSSSGFGDIGGSTPSRGQIYDVTIQLFNMLPDARPDVPDETITTQNVQFDNATHLITTEAADDGHGSLIARDQIPVHMRSDADHRGYDFDGRGLRLRWNDKDGRLDLLEVAHGEQLVVKDTSSSAGVFGGSARASKAPASASATTPTPSTSSRAGANAAGSTTAPAASPSAVTAPRAKPVDPPAPPVPYLVTFYDAVRITQGDEVLITSNRMDIDFVSRQKSQAAGAATPTTKPASALKTADASTTAPVAPSSVAPVATASESAAAHAVATTGTASRPAAAPVVIRWTGKLVMMSAQPNRPKVEAGDAIVDLTGAPVAIRRTPAGQHDGDDVKAGEVVYHTGEGNVRLLKSKATPAVVISKLFDGKIDPGSTVTTEALDYGADASGRKVAVLSGVGHAAMPMEARATGGAAPATMPAVAMMDTHWKNGARVFFAGKGQDEQAVEHVELAGDVDVKHPQLALQSQALALYFSPSEKAAAGKVIDAPASGSPATMPATRPIDAGQQLRRVTATEAVHCVLAGQAGKSQTIDCNALDMQTSRSDDGKFYARQVDARGAVHAVDDDQDLRADVVTLLLKPAAKKPTAAPAAHATSAQTSDAHAMNAAATHAAAVAATQPADDSQAAAVDLEKMTARDNVLVTKKDGSLATGSELVVVNDGGENHIRLSGQPDALVVDAKKNTVSGPMITFEQGVAHVAGAGKMHLLQDAQNGAAKQPMDVAWVDRADLAGKDNRVDIYGSVTVTTVDAEGAVSVAGGDHVHIDLMDKPTPATQPSTLPTARPARPAAAQPTTLPTGAKAPAADAMQAGMASKEVRTVTLEGHAQVVSTLSGPGGAVLRQFALFAPKIIYQLADSKEQAAHTLLAPAAGKMYVGDHRPTAAAKTPHALDAAPEEDGGSRGDTAFQWSKQLLYSETARRAMLTGDVVVVHQPLSPTADADRVRINADRMTAWFAAAPRPATSPGVAPTTNPPGDLGQSLQLKHLTGDGNVAITRANGAALYANQIDFDPLTHWMTAHGAANVPARYVDPDPKHSLAAQIIQWNTATWDLVLNNSKMVNPK